MRLTEKWVKVGEERLTETQNLNSRGAGAFEAQENMALCGWEMQTETEEKSGMAVSEASPCQPLVPALALDLAHRQRSEAQGKFSDFSSSIGWSC